MSVKDAIKILLSKGYDEDTRKVEKNRTGHYFYKRLNTIDCVCNKKPPLIEVLLSTYGKYSSIEVTVVAETDTHRWVNCKFYALPIREIENIDYFEEKLTAMWEIANKRKS